MGNQQICAGLGKRLYSKHNSPVHGTADTENVFLSHMGINHRRFDARMAKEFLNRSDIAAPFQKVGRETVAIIPCVE